MLKNSMQTAELVTYEFSQGAVIASFQSINPKPALEIKKAQLHYYPPLKLNSKPSAQSKKFVLKSLFLYCYIRFCVGKNKRCMHACL